MKPIRTDSRWGLVLLGGLLAIGSADASDGHYLNLPSMNLARQETGAARIDDRVYVVGGLLAGFPFTATDTMESFSIYGPSTQWVTEAPMPGSRDHAAVAAVGGRLYVMGGYDGDFNARDQVWIYDPTSGAWSVGSSLPEPRGAAWAVEHDGLIYLFGGVNAIGLAQATGFVYDPVADSWAVAPSMFTPREHLTAVSTGTAIHVLGGRAGAATAAHERFDPSTGQWTVLPPLPTARSASATAYLDGRIHVMGGEVPMLFAVHEVFDLSTGTWECAAPMPIPRHGCAAVPLDDRILLPAGGTVQGLDPTTQVDAFIPDGAGFVRGDCNTDGSIDLADVVALLDVLFLGGTSPCLDACHANDANLTIDISDAVTLLGALFGQPPSVLPAPATCGSDESPDTLSCVSYPSCP